MTSPITRSTARRRFIVAAAAAVSGLMLVAVGCGPSAAAKSDNATEAQRLVTAGATLLDVRTPAEFSRGHIKGAVNIPVQVLKSRLAELGAKDKQVVVYCHSGRRSAVAKKLMESKGFAKVHDLGGMSSWPGKK